MADQLYNQFADLTELERVRDYILKDIFGKIKDGVLDLSKTTFKIDGANSSSELKKVMEDLKVKEKELADQSKKLAETQSQLALLMTQTAAGTKAQADGYKGLSDQMSVNIQRQIQLKDRLTEIAGTLKKANEFKQAAKDSAEFNEEIVKLTAEQSKLKVQLEATNKLIKNQTKEFIASSGSIDEQRAQINQLTQVYDSLSEAQQNSEEGTKLLAQIQQLDQKLKDVEGTTGRFQRNVGNYANSLAGGFEQVRKEIRRVQDERDALAASFKTRTSAGFVISTQEQERLNKVNGSLTQLNKIQSLGADTTIGFTQKVKQLSQEYQNLVAGGTQTNEFLNDFKKFVADAKDQTEDLKAEIKALSSDTFVFDQIASGMKTATAAFQIGAGVAELFGSENENIQKSIQRLIIIQNVANGVQEIANQLTLRGSIINKGYVFIQGLMTIAFNSSATAAARFNAALGLIGIAATVIGAIVIAMSAFKKTVDETVEKIDNFNDVLKDSGSAYTTAVSQVNNLRLSIGLAKDGFIEKKDVVKLYNDTLGKTTGEVKSLDEAEKALTKNADAYIRFTLLKAAANIALGKAAQEAFDQTLRESKPIETPDFKGLSPDVREKKLKDFENFSKDLKNASKKISEREVDSFNKIAETLFTQAAAISKEFKFNFFGDSGGGGSTNAKQAEDFANDLAKIQSDITKTNFEALKKRREDEIKALEEITNNTNLGYFERYAASQRFYDKSKALIDLNAAYEIAQINKSAEEEKRLINAKLNQKDDKGKLTLTIKQRNDLNEQLRLLDKKLVADENVIRANGNSSILALDKNSEKQRTDIFKTEYDNRKKIIEEEQKFRESHQAAVQDINIQKIQNDYATAQNLLEERLSKGLISEENYNRRKLKLEAELQTKLLEAEINQTVSLIEEQEKRFAIDEAELQHKIDIAKAEAELETDPDKKKDRLSGIKNAEQSLTQIKISNNDTVAKSSAQLNSLLIKLDNIRINIFKKNNKDAKDDFEKTFKDIAGAATTAFDLIGGFISASVDIEKNKIQEQIDLLEKKKQKEIEVVNAGIGSAEEKAAKIKIIEARAEAQRQQLELKKRQAQEKQARFEKAANIANIITTTALAVIKALAEGDPATKIPRAIAAGAIGAAQLAVAIATPIPKFYKGTQSSPEGLAEVAERGPELAIDKKGKTTLFDKHTLTYLTKGTKIFPADVTKDILRAAEIERSGMMKSFHNNVNVTVPDNRDLLESTLGELKQLNKKSRIVIINNPAIETSAYYQQQMKH